MTERQPPRPIAYAPLAPGVSRRSFRLLLLLTLINTIMLGANITGPGIVGFVRQQWADYQRRQAARKVQAQEAIARQAYLPAQQQCMNYLAPAGTLLYAEDPEGIQRLVSAGPVNQVCRNDMVNRPDELASLPVGAAAPSFLMNMPTTPRMAGEADHYGPLFDQPHDTLLFLHQCRTSAGSRLVAVYVSNSQSDSQKIHPAARPQNASDHWSERDCNYTLHTSRQLLGIVMSPVTSAADLALLTHSSLYLNAGTTLVTDTGALNFKVAVDYAGQLRLFAGQPDSADPALFHIPYELDGVRGSIDGRLTADDQIQLLPDRYLMDMEAKSRAFVIPSPDKRRATGKPG